MLEVLLAVTILALVFATVYSIWNASITAWKRSSAASEIAQRQRIVTEALVELTRSVVLLPTDNGLYNVTGSGEDGQSAITFVTASDALLPGSEALAAGMRQVTISMQTDQYGRPFLAIQNQPALVAETATDVAPVHVLSADVVWFGVRYRNPRDGSWKEAWDDTAVVPGAVEYTVAFANGGGDPVVVTRAIELPAAQFVTQSRGEAQNKNNSTNTVSRRDVQTQTSRRKAGGGT